MALGGALYHRVPGPDHDRGAGEEIEVGEKNAESVRLVNCAFWGPCIQIAKVAGTGTVGFGDCTFTPWGGKDGNRPAIQARVGR